MSSPLSVCQSGISYDLSFVCSHPRRDAVADTYSPQTCRLPLCLHTIPVFLRRYPLICSGDQWLFSFSSIKQRKNVFMATFRHCCFPRHRLTYAPPCAFVAPYTFLTLLLCPSRAMVRGLLFRNVAMVLIDADAVSNFSMVKCSSYDKCAYFFVVWFIYCIWYFVSCFKGRGVIFYNNIFFWYIDLCTASAR